MKPKSLASFILMAILILNIPFLILSGESLKIIYEKSFYQKEFGKNGVYESFQDTDLPDNLAGQIISYFKDNTHGPPQIPLFTDDENKHLLDVKQVIQKLADFAYVSLALILLSILLYLIFFKSSLQKDLGTLLLSAGILTLVLCASLVLLALNFGWAFANFHYLLFPQGNWMFPRESTLIMLFPEGLFQDFFVAILSRSIMTGILILLSGVILTNMGKDYKTKLKPKRRHGKA